MSNTTKEVFRIPVSCGYCESEWTLEATCRDDLLLNCACSPDSWQDKTWKWDDYMEDMGITQAPTSNRSEEGTEATETGGITAVPKGEVS